MTPGDSDSTSARRPKICQICAEDCSARPRVKDSKGRYYCKACAEAASGRRSPIIPPADDTPPHDAGADVARQIAQEYADDEIAVEPVDDTPRDQTCPICMRPLAPDTGRCHACGYDPAKGIESSRRVSRSTGANRPKIPCPRCGYDMTGLRTLRCPECGATRNPDLVDLTSGPKRPVLDALKAPLICFAAGMVGLTVAGFFLGEPLLPLGVLLTYVVTVPIGLLIFYLCCLVWIGFDAPFYINAAAILGTYAITDFVGAIVSPLGCFGWIVQMFVYVGVLSQLLELELNDAFLVAFITGFVKFLLALALISAMGGF